MKFNVLRSYLGKISIRYERVAHLVNEFPQFEEYASSVLAPRFPKSIFTDQVVYSFEDRDQILDLLNKHIKKNIVKIGDKYYRQSIGIPQGSVLSPMLCSYLYADLERNHLKHLPGAHPPILSSIQGSQSSDDWCYFSDESTKVVNILSKIGQQSLSDSSQNKSLSSSDSSSNNSSTNSSSQLPIGVLMRLIDDFIYITSSQEASKEFVTKMHKGFTEYGISINKEKTRLNYNLKITNNQTGEEDIYKPKRYITWCGLVIDTQTFQITMDYSRYTDLSEKISKDFRNPGLNLSRKLKQ